MGTGNIKKKNINFDATANKFVITSEEIIDTKDNGSLDDLEKNLHKELQQIVNEVKAHKARAMEIRKIIQLIRQSKE